MLVVSALTASAQECRLTGSVIDKDTKEKMEQTTVQLLRKDSSYVAGTVTDDRGVFALKVDRKGEYILKISSVGYDTRIVMSTSPTLRRTSVSAKSLPRLPLSCSRAPPSLPTLQR